MFYDLARAKSWLNLWAAKGIFKFCFISKLWWKWSLLMFLTFI